jgi:hypothetical protein
MITRAARNNALWCDTVCRTHGLSATFGGQTWASHERSPRLYPDAVTLAPGLRPEQALAGVVTGPGCSVKDSYADVDLSGHGFSVLFEAQWIVHPGAALPSDLKWSAGEDFEVWADAWSGGQPQDVLVPELLFDPLTTLLTGTSDGVVTAGAITYRTDDVVGVSNVFGPPDQAWPGLIGQLTQRFPGIPIVGYERGGDPAAARRYCCEPIGPLRVWIS